MNSLVYFFVVGGHTAFMPLKLLYPECLYLIERHTSVEPLQCFARSCPANQNCADALVHRVDYLFTEVMPTATQLFVYFTFRNEKYYTKHGSHTSGGLFTQDSRSVASLGAALFDKDLSAPRWFKLNRWGFDKCKNAGETFQWRPTTEFLTMGGSGKLISAESLIHRP